MGGADFVCWNTRPTMLRLATSEDLEFVHSLFMHESINPYLAFDPMPLEEFRPVYGDMLDEADVLIFEERDQPVGMAQIRWGTDRYAHSTHLGGIAIAPSAQGLGMGRQLMNELLQKAREMRLRRIELTVSADNDRAIRFYQSLGFQLEGTMRDYFTRADQDGYHDEHMMALLL